MTAAPEKRDTQETPYPLNLKRGDGTVSSSGDSARGDRRSLQFNVDWRDIRLSSTGGWGEDDDELLQRSKTDLCLCIGCCDELGDSELIALLIVFKGGP
ncbi:hypothetical protein N7535_008602 [Penicillium sp. DV-2018c]|nr:hypothetical protein N7461_002358 [Penicillium sp. DV-2018c]KAJ5563438.1 hypothetical protein N7535_008602 [Penicillium sp. DV-2018c]